MTNLSRELDRAIARCEARLHERRQHAERIAKQGIDTEGALAVVARMEQALRVLQIYRETDAIITKTRSQSRGRNRRLMDEGSRHST